jgi:nicotinate-nucleotide adenylyltransferase
MIQMKELQEKINSVFIEHFSKTPLNERLKDILNESIELSRFTDIKNIKEEAGDLLCSVIQLCNESDFDVEDVINNCLEKIKRRKLQYKSLGRKYKVALLGISGNPTTLGHIQICKYVLNTCAKEFDEVWIMPNYCSITGKNIISFEHRYNMCKLSIDDSRIKVFDYENKHQLAGETYHLVKKLMNDPLYENYNFSFILGQDNANIFNTFVNFEELEKMIRFIIVPRKGYEPTSNIWYTKIPHIYLNGKDEDVPIIEVSSTDIREKIKNGENVDNLIHPNVLLYIKENKLYLE